MPRCRRNIDESGGQSSFRSYKTPAVLRTLGVSHSLIGLSHVEAGNAGQNSQRRKTS